MRRRATLALVLAALLACGTLVTRDRNDARWYRGNTHTHTLWSDGDAAPELAIGWYRDHGYDFLALTEHNVLARGVRWLPVEEDGRLTPTRAAALRTAFGERWIETRVAENGGEEMRLKTLDDLRARFESPSFLMITGEEVSDAFLETPIHVNGLNLHEVIPPQGGTNKVETMQRNFDAIAAQGERLGRPVLAHLNHPNFYWAFSAEDIARIRGERFFEVYNGHPRVHNAGDASHPSTERLWDIALTLRLSELDLGLMYGIAVDDAHNYYEYGLGSANPGRGWVMVRARELAADALIEAMNDGHFYATSGVLLQDFAAGAGSLSVSVQAEHGLTYTTTFIGTRMRGDGPGEVGEVLASTTSNPARYDFAGDELYVRAKVTSSRLHPNPAEAGEFECAWVQPARGGAR